jgi:hypothetical protein
MILFLQAVYSDSVFRQYIWTVYSGQLIPDQS